MRDVRFLERTAERSGAQSKGGAGWRSGEVFSRRFFLPHRSDDKSCFLQLKPTPAARRKAEEYADKLRSFTPEVRPVTVGGCAGVLQFSRTPRPARLALRMLSIATDVKEGDYRDWAAIRSWTLSQPEWSFSLKADVAGFSRNGRFVRFADVSVPTCHTQRHPLYAAGGHPRPTQPTKKRRVRPISLRGRFRQGEAT